MTRVSEEELAAFRLEVEEAQTNYANPLFRIPITFLEIFPVGMIITLISAALLRRPGFTPTLHKSRFPGSEIFVGTMSCVIWRRLRQTHQR